MYIFGSFNNISGDTISVHILTNGDNKDRLEIGGTDSGIMFTEDPVEIESCVNDTFDHLLRRQAAIRLLTRSFIPQLFCTSCMDAVVNIYKNGKCVFAGYVEPQAYSQSYAEVYDELEITCIDALSALQYSQYRNIGGLGVSYAVVKATAERRTFYDILIEALNGVTSALDIVGGNSVNYYYDDSKALNDIMQLYNIFGQIAISELLFLGDGEDDVWSNDEVLTSILKYLNLHLVQDGFDFYIYSWETLTADSDEIAWKAINTGAERATQRRIVDFGSDNSSDCDTSISIGEVYNQISLKCDVEEIENLIDNPLSEDALISPYSNRQKYMTEIVSDHYGDFANMIKSNKTPTSGKDSWVDWFIQIKTNPAWIFPRLGYWSEDGSRTSNWIDIFCRDNYYQYALPNESADEQCAFIVSLGKQKHVADDEKKDNSPISKIEMTDYLVVSVNGNKEDDLEKAYPNDSVLLANCPRAVYNGPSTGTVYSPSDDDTTNYIVISGKLVLNPIPNFTVRYPNTVSHGLDDVGWWQILRPIELSDGGYWYYTQKYYTATTPSDTPVADDHTDVGLVPFTGNFKPQYEFKYSAKGDSADHISKISVLECMLIVGNKCVVETGTSGQISDFEWRDYKPMSECADLDEYYSQSFSIGFDPKIGDKLIGTSFDLQNNIDYTLGIDAEGIAIPVRKSDKLSGAVKFIILGPVNTVWNEITHRHRTWFRSSKWSSNDVPLLSHVQNILIEKLEVKIYSDNGLINGETGNDLIYVSDTKETFVNKKDDIDFEINSALTSDECREIGVSNGVKLSTAIDLSTDVGLLTIHDFNKRIDAKPEQLYVDAYYAEYHKPRVQMTHKVADNGDISLFNRYRHPAMPDKLFIAQGIGYNLRENNAELNLKETWND